MADWLAPNCSRVPTAAKLSSITVYPSCMPLRQDPLLGEVAIDSRPFFFFFFFVFLCSNNLLMARFPYFFLSSSTRIGFPSLSLSFSHCPWWSDSSSKLDTRSRFVCVLLSLYNQLALASISTATREPTGIHQRSAVIFFFGCFTRPSICPSLQGFYKSLYVYL